MTKINEKEENNRTKQLGLKVREDFYWKVKELALKRRCHIVELIEESVELFQIKERERESKSCQETVIEA